MIPGKQDVIIVSIFFHSICKVNIISSFQANVVIDTLRYPQACVLQNLILSTFLCKPL